MPLREHGRQAGLVIVRVLLAALLSVTSAQACTAFLLKDGRELAVGRNYDWSVDDGLILVNKTAIAKTAFGQSRPARWVSRYGSVTLNQYGRELPLEGMNQAGLVIATLWLDETRLPAGETLPALSSLQWVQYQLDLSASVAEVLARDSVVAVTPGAGSSVHFFIADSGGNCAVVEYLDGRRVHRVGTRAIANNRYSESESTLAGLRPFGGTAEVPTDFGSLARFARAAFYLKQYDPADSIGLMEYGQAMLQAVSSGMSTKWSLVYDIPARRIWLRTQRNPSLRRIDLRDFEFAGRQPARMLDVNARLSGALSRHFADYTLEANRALIFKVFRRVEFLRDTPTENLEALARYPETLRWVGNE